MQLEYTIYFSEVIKENGIPNLSPYQFRRLLNIIAVENRIQGIFCIKNQLENTPEFYKYDVILFKYQRQLTELTGNIKPDELLKEMYTFDSH